LGQFARFGTSIRIDATVQDIKSGHTDSLKVDVANDNEIPAAVDRLADSIRQKLALPASVLSDLKASSFQPTSKSVPHCATSTWHHAAARRQES